MPDNKDEDVLLDAQGRPADKKAEFEIRRKVIGKRVQAVRFCSDEEYEPGKRGATFTIYLEDGEALMVAATGGVDFFVSMKENPQGENLPRRLM